ncbi:hypothetical protein KM043_007213 [Ampulex compressa]|nr:hypothetical protein KM043_007213 [Ampulex compressa]
MPAQYRSKRKVPKCQEAIGYSLKLSDQDNGDSETNSEVTSAKEYDPTIDERLPETVTLLTTSQGGKVYLVGTAHFSVESQNDVSTIIQAVQPHTVVVELCKARIGILQLDEEVLYRYTKNLTFQCMLNSIKQYGVYNGLVYVLMLKTAAHVAKELGMAPGGEFRRAFEEAKKVPNCTIHLADRAIDITIQRAIRSLSWWQTLKFWWYLMNIQGHISKEEVELCKQRNLLDDMIAELKEEFPTVEESTINKSVPPRVVGVVGIGHTSGIIQNWRKINTANIPPIMSIPPQALSTKILKYTVWASFMGTIIYMGYKIIPLPSGATLQSIKSSVEEFIKSLLNYFGFFVDIRVW